MSSVRPYRPRGSHFLSDGISYYDRHCSMGMRVTNTETNYNWVNNTRSYESNFCIKNFGSSNDFSRKLMLDAPNYDRVWSDALPSSKRRKVSNFSSESSGRPYQQQIPHKIGLENHVDLWQHAVPHFFNTYCNAPLANESNPSVTTTRSNSANAHASNSSKRDRFDFENDMEMGFMSRDEIDRCSPSRKDGIDVMHETHLRYSYCSFLQNLGFRLDLPQTTIGTAMVLCHRFFVRRSHACHDRFLIATAALFLTSKSEETPRPLHDVLRVSCEIFHKQEFSVLCYTLQIDWFEQYRERILEAEQLILTTLNFELSVQHPYESLISTLQKLGYSQSRLVNVALDLVSEGLRSSLWLQFKPHQIAAGAAYLAAKSLQMNLASCDNAWHAFHTPPNVLRDIAHQLMELFPMNLGFAN